MDIQYVKQDITTVDRGVIAHGCNTQGVMGAGVAKFLRNKHPSIFPDYQKICKEQNEDALLGQTHFVIITNELVVANCFTQHLGKPIYRPRQYEGRALIAAPDAIENSVEKAMMLATLLKLPFYMPKIGAGLGGLDWDQDVEPIIARLANPYRKLPIYVCVWP